MHSRLIFYILVALAIVGALVGLRRQLAFSQPAPTQSLKDESVVSLLLEFGVDLGEPRSWDGTIRATGGEILNLRNWRPRPGDQMDGKSGWKLETRRGINFKLRPWEKARLTAPHRYLLTPGVVVDVKGSTGTVVRVSLREGSFDVRPFQMELGRSQLLDAGAVRAERVPVAQVISPPDAQSDFAAISAGAGGDVWVVWVAYRNGANAVMARRFDGGSRLAVESVSGDHKDIYVVKSARDRNGHAWFVWSSQVAGNWDLYGRRWDGKAWSSIERLTEDAQPDFAQQLATDSGGNLWLAWQGFRNGKSDIFARRYDGSSWSAVEKVSTSPANDWEPAIAADGSGRVYVAWDTYDKGNYDVYFRRMRMEREIRMEAPVPVAASAKFEAHVSLACDKQNRLWAAWNETGVEWGKDTGFIPKQEGTRLYESRWMGVAVWTGSAWQEPVAGLEASLPPDLRGYNDLPQLAADGAGRVWLLFRHRMLRIRDTPSDTPAHRAAWQIHAVTYEGDRWSPPWPLPFSQGRQDMKAGYAPDGAGGIYAAWPTDNRDFEEFLFEKAEILAARVPLPKAAAVAPKLRPRAPAEVTYFPAYESERADLDRIHGHSIQAGGKTYRIYRGDTHRHTEFSMDGNNDGSLHDTYRYAIDAAELDYLMVSEHNGAGGPDVEYINWQLQQAADLYHLPGKFVPFYGYERSVNYPNGHRNVIFAVRGNPSLPIPASEQKALTGAQALYEYLKKYKGIAISHTSATNMGTDWRDTDPAVEPLVEIYQGDRVSAEYEGAPKAAYTANLASAPGGFRPAGYVWNAWAKGYKLGVQVASDHLSTHISYACTLAPELTRPALLDAMRARHSYGATDNIILDYRIAGGGRDYLQGEAVRISGPFRLAVKAFGTRPIRQVDVIKNNKFVHTLHPLTDMVEFSFTDTQASSGESYYYVRIIQVDEQMAWSSPIWVTLP